MSVLYLSFDGLLDPLGFSQVVRPVLALAQRGVPHSIVSLARAATLRDPARAAALTEQLARHGVHWRYGVFRDGGGAQFAANCATLLRQSQRLGRHRLLHARSFQAATVAHALSKLWRAPFVYDTRGFFLAQRQSAGSLGQAAALAFSAVERRIVADAAAIVSLTELGVDDLRAGVLGRVAPRTQLVTIPTCADFDEFSLTARPAKRAAPTVGFIGSVNADYLLGESMALAAALARRLGARLLIVSQQHDAVATAALRAGLRPEHLDRRNATHAEMPKLLSSVDFGLLLLRSHPSKRASMPTKLGEFLAAGVRPLHTGCNAEVSAWVSTCGSGLTFGAQESVEVLAERAATLWQRDTGDLIIARERAAPHFSLASGVERYAKLLRSLL